MIEASEPSSRPRRNMLLREHDLKPWAVQQNHPANPMEVLTPHTLPHYPKNNTGKKPQKPHPNHCSSKITPPAKMTTYTRPPANWPIHLPYLSTLHLDPSLTHEQLVAFHPSTIPLTTTSSSPTNPTYQIHTQATFSPLPNRLITIQKITLATHPRPHPTRPLRCPLPGRGNPYPRLHRPAALLPSPHLLDKRL